MEEPFGNDRDAARLVTWKYFIAMKQIKARKSGPLFLQLVNVTYGVTVNDKGTARSGVNGSLLCTQTLPL